MTIKSDLIMVAYYATVGGIISILFGMISRISDYNAVDMRVGFTIGMITLAISVVVYGCIFDKEMNTWKH